MTPRGWGAGVPKHEAGGGMAVGIGPVSAKRTEGVAYAGGPVEREIPLSA
jgi:hypothetical protein